MAHEEVKVLHNERNFLLIVRDMDPDRPEEGLVGQLWEIHKNDEHEHIHSLVAPVGESKEDFLERLKDLTAYYADNSPIRQ